MKRIQGRVCGYICGYRVNRVNTLHRCRTVRAYATLHAYKHGSPICRSVLVTHGTPVELCTRRCCADPESSWERLNALNDHPVLSILRSIETAGAVGKVSHCHLIDRRLFLLIILLIYKYHQKTVQIIFNLFEQAFDINASIIVPVYFRVSSFYRFY